jgi:hypothetical protein
MLIALLRCAPVDSFAPAQLALRAAFGSLSLSVDSQDLPTRSSFGAALRQSISTFPKGLDSPLLRAAFGSLSPLRSES